MSDRERPPRRGCGGPPTLATVAVDEWMAALRRCPPWNEMALDDVAGEFRAVLMALLHSNDDAEPDRRAAHLRRVSRAHGAFRRRQGCPAVVLTEEIAFAAGAISSVLARGGAAPSAVSAFADSLAPVMQAIHRAAYNGYADRDVHREPGS